MTEENALVAKPTAVIPTDSKSFQSISSDHMWALRKAQEELERRVVDRTAKLAQANESPGREIKERRKTEELLQKEQRHLRYMLELQDRDRQLVAYEIHDGLVQQLAGAIMQFEMFSRATEHKVNEVRKTFEDGLEMLSESMREGAG